MKNGIVVFLMLLSMAFSNALQAQNTSTDSTKTSKIINSSSQTVTPITPAGQKDTPVVKKDDKTVSKTNNDYGDVSIYRALAAGLILLIVMILIHHMFDHVKRMNQHIGFHTIKIIGLILIFPILAVLILLSNGPTALISENTTATLFGAIIGYVLSKDTSIPKDDKTNN